jgi:hypothetical protein
VLIKSRKGTVYGEITGYVQQIYMSNLQGIAVDAIITINAVPNFSAIDKPLFYILLNEKTSTEADYNELRKAFVIGNMRYFHEDPVGLITLSEIVVLYPPVRLVQQFK